MHRIVDKATIRTDSHLHVFAWIHHSVQVFQLCAQLFLQNSKCFRKPRWRSQWNPIKDSFSASMALNTTIRLEPLIVAIYLCQILVHLFKYTEAFWVDFFPCRYENKDVSEVHMHFIERKMISFKIHMRSIEMPKWIWLQVTVESHSNILTVKRLTFHHISTDQTEQMAHKVKRNMRIRFQFRSLGVFFFGNSFWVFLSLSLQALCSHPKASA